VAHADRETAQAIQRVQEAETAIMHKQEYMEHVEKGQSTTSHLEIISDMMLNTIKDSLSDLAHSEDAGDGEDEDDDEEDTGLGGVSEDDKPGWVMGTSSKTVQYCMGCFRQMQMKLDQLMQSGWRDAANKFQKRDMRYRTTELKLLAVGEPQSDTTAAIQSLTTFGEFLQDQDIVPGQTQMPQVTSR
jgi:hypothetical protein